MARFFDLPLELRQEIYRFACLPEPAVYCLSDPDIFDLPRSTRQFKSSERISNWRVIKRRYPTAVHLCRESRSYAWHIQRHENVRAARLGVQPTDYQIGKGQRLFEPEIDIVFVRTWRLLCALDRHVIHAFPFPDSFLDVKHIALDVETTTYKNCWLPFYHIFQRFPKLRNLSIVFQGGREFAETRLHPRLARITEYDVEESSQEELVCQRVDGSLQSHQLINPVMKYSNHLWSPTTQLVAKCLGLGHKIKVSAALLTVGHSGSCSNEEHGDELVVGSDREWPDYSLLFETDFYSDAWWEEELQNRYGIGKPRKSMWARISEVLPCKWAVLAPLYYFFLIFYLYYY